MSRSWWIVEHSIQYLVFRLSEQYRDCVAGAKDPWNKVLWIVPHNFPLCRRQLMTAPDQNQLSMSPLGSDNSIVCWLHSPDQKKLFTTAIPLV
jgi:hypothetical protein